MTYKGELTDLQTQLKALSKAVDEKDSQNKELYKEIQVKEKELKRFEDAIPRKKEEFLEQNKKLDTLKADIADKELSIKKIDKKKEELDSIKNLIEELKTTKAILTNDKKELEDSIKKMEDNLSKSNRIANDHKETIKSLFLMTESAQEELDELNNTILKRKERIEELKKEAVVARTIETKKARVKKVEVIKYLDDKNVRKREKAVNKREEILNRRSIELDEFEESLNIKKKNLKDLENGLEAERELYGRFTRTRG